MLNQLKWYACYSMLFGIAFAFAGSGIYVLWLEVRHSAAYESLVALHAITVESWANSPHQHATVMDMVITGSIAVAGTVVMISPILGAWALLNRLDSHGPQNSQVERDSEDTRNEKG